MPKRLFQSFPLMPSEAEMRNSEVAKLAASYGGLFSILDQQTEVPTSFLAELESQDYSAKEFSFYRRLLNSQGRETILLSLACLGHLVAGSEDGLLKELYKGYFFNLADERKSYAISYEEIGLLADEIGPLLSGN